MSIRFAGPCIGSKVRRVNKRETQRGGRSFGSVTKAWENSTAAKKPTVQAVQFVESFEGSESPPDPIVLAQGIVVPRRGSLGVTPSQVQRLDAVAGV
jgi:hypothetical protein